MGRHVAFLYLFPEAIMIWIVCALLLLTGIISIDWTAMRAWLS